MKTLQGATRARPIETLPRTTLHALVLGVAALGFTASATAQLDVGNSLLDACAEIEPLRADGKITEARKAARSCVEGLQQEIDSAIGDHFHENVAGWKRTRFDQTATMGMRNAEATYERDGKRVKVSLISGTGSSIAGALGSLARLGAVGGIKQVKVAGLPTNVMPTGQVMVNFEDGSMLNFESPNFQTANEALSGMGDLIDKFPVAAIRDALAGG